MSVPHGQSTLYSSNASGNYELYRMDTTGKSQTRITFTDSLNNLSPVRSPDGQFIAYSSNKNGEQAIYL